MCVEKHMTDIESGVLKLVQTYVGKRATLNSELYHDLHLHGDDAGELLEAIHERHGTVFDGFNFKAYFPNETEGLPRVVKWMGVKDRTVGSFTVRHLAKCVEIGRWFEPT